ncbi:hypothetical protein NE237_016083 [Protea cynaroides]|uniref:Uncharacterized protein n=1 Tax=Protea cynaroides TaxID=273540 RepID=A0A9Q0KF76_9MAGN|nr:hypothetical protein NE237_016083 [Protea cynaroides]
MSIVPDTVTEDFTWSMLRFLMPVDIHPLLVTNLVNRSSMFLDNLRNLLFRYHQRIPSMEQVSTWMLEGFDPPTGPRTELYKRWTKPALVVPDNSPLQRAK